MLSGRAAAERYVELLTGSKDTQVWWRVFHDSKEGAPAYKEYGSVAELWDDLCNINQQGYGVYIVVNDGGNKDEEITSARSNFIDSDNVPLPEAEKKWHEPPSFIVYRKDVKWHAHWLTASDYPIELHRAAQVRLADYYGTDGSVCNPSRVMRVPGFKHMKDPAHPAPVTLIDLTHGAEGEMLALERLPYEKIVAGLPELSEPLKARERKDYAKDPMHREPPEGGWDQPGSEERARRLLRATPYAVSGTNNREGNDRIFWLACRMGDEGVSHAVAWAIFNEAVDASGESWLSRSTYSGNAEVTVKNAYRYRGSRAGTSKHELESLRNRYREELGRGQSDSDASPVSERVLHGEVLPPERQEIAQVSDFMPWSQFAATRTLPRMLVDRMMRADGLVALVGERGLGKSVIMTDLAHHIVTGKTDWHGNEIDQTVPWRVCYMAGEDDGGVSAFNRAWIVHHGCLPPDDRYFAVDKVPDLYDRKSCAEWIEKAKRRINAQPTILMLDTFQRGTLGISQSDDKLIPLAVANAEWMAGQLRGPTLAAFHPPHSDKARIIGTTWIGNATTTILTLTAEGPAWIKLKVVRIKGAAAGAHIVFERKDVEIPGLTDQWGRPRAGIVLKKVSGIGGPSTEAQNEAQGDLREKLAYALAWLLKDKGAMGKVALAKEMAKLAGGDFSAGRIRYRWKGEKLSLIDLVAFGTEPYELADGTVLRVRQVDARSLEYSLDTSEKLPDEEIPF